MLQPIIGTSSKPAASKLLIKALSSVKEDGYIFIGYPIVGGGEIGSIDAFLISPSYGIILFDLVEGETNSQRASIRDLIFNSIQSKLIAHKNLTTGRGKLKIELNVITFAPAWNSKYDDNEVATTEESLLKLLKRLNNSLPTLYGTKEYEEFLSAIQALTKLKSRPPRSITNAKSKGSILNEIEKSISVLDKDQSKAVIETADGIQRIRGLAGSGKTIVLALKIAYLHANNPDWDIAVTFYTRSLKSLFIELITKFTIEHKGEEPDWDKISILQAWGSYNDPGIYYQFCTINNLEYFNYDEAKIKYPYSSDYLEELCTEALDNCKNPTPVYDCILIDEAQDFSQSFLKLAYLLVKPVSKSKPFEKRLIYAYDELQKLNDSDRLPSPKEIFGKDVEFANNDGSAKQDIMLEVCYRNSAPVLVTAHALGFGIYRSEGLVTMFKDKELWQDVGYRVISGNLDYGKDVTLERSQNSSPNLILKYCNKDELLEGRQFDDRKSEYEWVAKNINDNLTKEDLTYKDIIVIHPNPKKTKTDVALLRQILKEKFDINSHLAGVSTSPDKFFLQDSIAITSIFRAKGNEGAMIYIICAEGCYSGYELIKKRNILFTAITRSKGWVKITGLGNDMKSLAAEFRKAKSNNYQLKFTYPTEEAMLNLNTIHRDLTEPEKKAIELTNNNLNIVLNELKKGTIKKEDLSKENIDYIRKMFLD